MKMVENEHSSKFFRSWTRSSNGFNHFWFSLLGMMWYQTQTPMDLIAHSSNPPSIGQREPWAIGSVGKETSGRIGLWANRPMDSQVRGQLGQWVNRPISSVKSSGQWGLWAIRAMGK